MITNRRTFLAGLASLAALTACGTQSPKSTSSPGAAESGQTASAAKRAVTVGLTYIPNVQFCAFYLGLKEGLFGDVDVTLRHHGEQEGLFEALQLGREDVVFASADEAVVAGSLATIATAYQQYPAQVMIAGKADSLAALKGKRLGIPGRYGSSYYAALAALKTAGLTEQDVQLVEIGYTAVTALTTKHVDAIIGFSNNELVQFNAQGFEVTALPVAVEAVLVGPSLVTTDARAKDAALAQIVEGMRQAEERAIADPQAALDATAEQVPALADPAQMANARAVLEATSKLWLDQQGKVSVAVDQQAMARMEAFLEEAGIAK